MSSTSPPTATLTVQAVEMLISRLCHDLVGPIGAIGNGVELLEEMPGAGAADMADALGLIADSVLVASRRLRLFRLAFGAAGGQGIAVADLHAVMEGWFRGGKIRFTWQAVLPSDPPPGLGKMLLAAAMLVDEAMPQGGELVLSTGPGGSVRLEGQGRAAGLRAEVAEALSGKTEVQGLTPRSVLAHAVAALATAHGMVVQPDPIQEGMIALNIMAIAS